MCTGLEIAALVGSGLSAAGSVIQQNEVAKNDKRMAEARNERLRNTLQKNDALAEQSRDTYNMRQQKATSDAIEEDRKEQTQKRETNLEDAVRDTPAPSAGVNISGSAPTVVKSELAKRMGDAMSDSKSQAKKLATLGGYGDGWLSQGFQDADAGRSIAGDANFAAGNMAILPHQQDIAEMRAYKPISPIGGLLQGFGSMMGSYGGGGGVPKKRYTSSFI